MSEQEMIHNSGWSIRPMSKFYDKIGIFGSSFFTVLQ